MNFSFIFPELFQNITIEERVTILETQVVEIEEDLTVLDEDVADLDQDVNFLFDEQVIQDERILILEQDNDVFDDQIESEHYLCNIDAVTQNLFQHLKRFYLSFFF